MKLDTHARYAPSHEWVRPEEEDVFILGISDHAQHSLGDIVFVDLPSIGAHFSAKASFGVIESVKAASDVYLPLEGIIVEINEALSDHPEQINQDCYGEGWLVRFKADNPGAWDELLSPEAYEAQVGTEE
ncbi:MAG: glycine cleavage system protein GcvH [Treponema sp.]|jgi:glycine cleavage system H protein|nr:glycine cleavage system protein GcvH [Treponema sp.]